MSKLTITAKRSTLLSIADAVIHDEINNLRYNIVVVGLRLRALTKLVVRFQVNKLRLLPARLNLVELQDCFEPPPGNSNVSDNTTPLPLNADEYRTIDAVVAMLKLLLNPRDEVSFIKCAVGLTWWSASS